MRVLVWIVEETWQATVAAAAAFLPADADITLLHVRSDAETVARGARDAPLGRSRRTSGEALDAISEQGARDLLADAQAALGRQAVLDARSGRIEYEVVAAAATADLSCSPATRITRVTGRGALDPPRATSSTTPPPRCSSSGPTRPPDEQPPRDHSRISTTEGKGNEPAVDLRAEPRADP